jgi:hypothetical protein
MWLDFRLADLLTAVLSLLPATILLCNDHAPPEVPVKLGPIEGIPPPDPAAAGESSSSSSTSFKGTYPMVQTETPWVFMKYDDAARLSLLLHTQMKDSVTFKKADALKQRAKEQQQDEDGEGEPIEPKKKTTKKTKSPLRRTSCTRVQLCCLWIRRLSYRKK